MKPDRFIALLLLAACSSDQAKVVPEVSDVFFSKAAILAAVPPERRREIEDLVATEIVRRRPDVEVFSTWEQFTDLDGVSGKALVDYLSRNDFDLLVTIAPRPADAAKPVQWTGELPADLGTYVEGLYGDAMLGPYSVRVVAWDVATKAPVYSKESEVLADALEGPRDVIDFAAATVTHL